jgi:hypothetical protein
MTISFEPDAAEGIDADAAVGAPIRGRRARTGNARDGDSLPSLAEQLFDSYGDESVESEPLPSDGLPLLDLDDLSEEWLETYERAKAAEVATPLSYAEPSPATVAFGEARRRQRRRNVMGTDGWSDGMRAGRPDQVPDDRPAEFFALDGAPLLRTPRLAVSSQPSAPVRADEVFDSRGYSVVTLRGEIGDYKAQRQAEINWLALFGYTVREIAARYPDLQKSQVAELSKSARKRRSELLSRLGLPCSEALGGVSRRLPTRRDGSPRTRMAGTPGCLVRGVAPPAGGARDDCYRTPRGITGVG